MKKKDKLSKISLGARQMPCFFNKNFKEDKMIKVITKIKNKFYLAMAGVTTGLLSVLPTPMIAYADQIGDTANKAADGIHDTAVGTVKPIVTIVAIIAAIILIAGGERGKQSVMSKAGVVILAIAIIIWAPNLINTVIGWFE